MVSWSARCTLHRHDCIIKCSRKAIRASFVSQRGKEYANNSIEDLFTNSRLATMVLLSDGESIKTRINRQITRDANTMHRSRAREMIKRYVCPASEQRAICNSQRESFPAFRCIIHLRTCVRTSMLRNNNNARRVHNHERLLSPIHLYRISNNITGD